MTPECDKLDYILSASSGALCGIMDVFLVGKPGESPLGDITDKWFANRTIDFAKICGYTGDKNSLSSAIKFLEKKFKIPYDQSVGGGIFRELIDLTPSNHHFKSLGHNPTLLGLFFSILNQFTNTSDFVSNGELISLNNSDGKFELQGKNIPSKLFCGIANWIGHLISDVSGSSSSKGRGMGIPSPIWAWSNDVIAIKAKLNIPVTEFDKSVNELGAYVNLMLSSTQLLVNPILGLQPKYGNEDFEKFVSWNGRKTDKALCNDFKTLIISFANLLYKIDLDDNDKRLLYKTFKGNKKMLSALNMKKKEFKIEILNAVEEALLYSYK